MNVEDVAKLLDADRPGWAYLVNLDILNMAETENCVLGQVYGDWEDGYTELADGDDRLSAEISHLTAKFKDQWVTEVKNRRVSDVTAEALEHLRSLGYTIEEPKKKYHQNGMVISRNVWDIIRFTTQATPREQQVILNALNNMEA